MRNVALSIVSLLLTGCMSALIDRAELDQRYAQTAQAQGVLSAVPLRIDLDSPPTVVNWWYAGTRDERHYLVYRELTWNESGKPIGKERWFRVPAQQLAVRSTIGKTRDDAKWLPLYEAAIGMPPPWDLPTSRLPSDPLPPDLIAPDAVDPAVLDPDTRAPRSIEPIDE